MLALKYLFIKFFLITNILGESSKQPYIWPLDPDTGLNAPQIIQKYGYPLEIHEVQTEDGYILTMHRIPYGLNTTNNSNTNKTKPAVLLMPGMTCCSAYYLNMGPEKSLGFLLADAGYDVWLGNQRGNTYSQKHINYDVCTHKAQFYNFSLHEVGVFDVPAKIDYILNVTDNTGLFYIGHSQGTTDFFILGSEKPEYNDKIILATILAPIVYMNDLKNPMTQLYSRPRIYRFIELFTKIFRIYQFLPHTRISNLITDFLCNNLSIFQETCAFILFINSGFDSPQLNRTKLTVIYTSNPAGSSIKTPLHYLQLVHSGKFRQYDYGKFGNLLQYGEATPPIYNISKVTAPVSLYYSSNDWMSAVSNVEQLIGELPNVATKHLVEYRKFNHLDFVFAIDVRDLLYNYVVDEMRQYNKYY